MHDIVCITDIQFCKLKNCKKISFFNEALITPDYAANAYSNSTLSLAFKILSIFTVLPTQSCTLLYPHSVETVSSPYQRSKKYTKGVDSSHQQR